MPPTHMRNQRWTIDGPSTKAGARMPIWCCSRWGLACQRCRQRRGGLLPHHFTLTYQVKTWQAVSFLCHFPSPWVSAARGQPRLLRLAVSQHLVRWSRTFLWSPCSTQRSSDPLSDEHINLIAAPDDPRRPIKCPLAPRDGPQHKHEQSFQNLDPARNPWQEPERYQIGLPRC